MVGRGVVGRAAELASLDRLVADLLAGRGSSVFVGGEAGVGKTMLLEQIRNRVEAVAGLRVLLVAGVEAESRLAFAALRDLLSPLVEILPQIPAAQAAALSSALALSEPRPGDRMVVCAATEVLLRCAGRGRPVLVIVDDIQWVDPSSRECVLFAARRAAGPAGFVIAGREEDAAAGCAGLPSLYLTGLDRPDAMQLVSDLAPEATASVAGAIVDSAGGNPLALRELVRSLDVAQRRGVRSLPLPLSPGPPWLTSTVRDCVLCRTRPGRPWCSPPPTAGIGCVSSPPRVLLRGSRSARWWPPRRSTSSRWTVLG